MAFQLQVLKGRGGWANMSSASSDSDESSSPAPGNVPTFDVQSYLKGSVDKKNANESAPASSSAANPAALFKKFVQASSTDSDKKKSSSESEKKAKKKDKKDKSAKDKKDKKSKKDKPKKSKDKAEKAADDVNKVLGRKKGDDTTDDEGSPSDSCETKKRPKRKAKAKAKSRTTQVDKGSKKNQKKAKKDDTKKKKRCLASAEDDATQDAVSEKKDQDCLDVSSEDSDMARRLDEELHLALVKAEWAEIVADCKDCSRPPSLGLSARLNSSCFLQDPPVEAREMAVPAKAHSEESVSRCLTSLLSAGDHVWLPDEAGPWI